jgi:hypothetical protein
MTMFINRVDKKNQKNPHLPSSKSVFRYAAIYKPSGISGKGGVGSGETTVFRNATQFLEEEYRKVRDMVK